jgi:hypothetical protein
MKVAAYQTPLGATISMYVIGLIRERVNWCESNGAEVLCCPEGVSRGLADYANRPNDIAIDVEAGELQALLAPLLVTVSLSFWGSRRLTDLADSIIPRRSFTKEPLQVFIASCTRRSTNRFTRPVIRCRSLLSAT